MSRGLPILVFVLLINTCLFAQLDTSFGNNGVSVISVSPVDSVENSFELADGKILILQQGKQTDSATQSQYNLVRLNSNGSIDTTYGNNGVSSVSIPFITTSENRVSDSFRQSDGKIILVGSDNDDGFITRINGDGTLDTTFANNGFHRPNFFNTDDYIDKVLLLPDGKIIVFGVTLANQVYRLFLIRYLSNGALDTTFGNTNEGFLVTNIQMGIVWSIGRQTSGKYIVNDFQSVIRLNADGSSDPTFQSIPFPTPYTSDSRFAVTTSDNIIVSDRVSSGSGLDPLDLDVKISRYNSNGSLDPSFGTNGALRLDLTSYQGDGTTDLKIDANGKIIASSSTFINKNKYATYGSHFSMFKISSNGVLEGKIMPTTGGSSKALILQSGRILQYGNRNLSVNVTDMAFDRLIDVPMTKYVFHASPFDFDLTGKATLSVFRPSTLTWYKGFFDGRGSFFGANGDILVPSDYRRNFRNEIAVFRPSTGFWYIADAFEPNPAQTFWSYQWGQNGDVPVPADFNGDGKSDIAVFRPSNGVWYILNTNDNSMRFVAWGMNGDKPVAGDYDGDGISDIAIWRPSNGLWCIFYSSNNQMAFVPFGLSTDIPVQEDYDGDGKYDIAVWRPSDGVWYSLKSSDGSFSAFAFGSPADNPVPADYDGDGKTDTAVKRNSDNKWYVWNSSSNSLSVFVFGLNTDIPLPIRY